MLSGTIRNEWSDGTESFSVTSTENEMMATERNEQLLLLFRKTQF